MNKRRAGEYDAACFDNLPQRCKEIFFDYLSHSYTMSGLKGAAAFVDTNGFNISDECKSPIEKIFDFAWQIRAFELSSNNTPIIEMQHQYKIKVADKTYYADFYFDSDFIYDEERQYRGKNRLKLIIECDGHDFHEKTKEQVKKDNERDFNLKMEGYEILHFSGSQIFNEPLKCTREVHEFIMRKVESWEEIKVGE